MKCGLICLPDPTLIECPFQKNIESFDDPILRQCGSLISFASSGLKRKVLL